jgi:glucoamylase
VKTVKARILGALGVLSLCAAVIVAATASASASTARAHAAPAPAVAPDAPGAMSYFDLARKDCVGTARNSTSKVWFTVADGVLSDTYWPTIDATNVHTLQYLVTDGHSFTDLQSRDMTYRVLPDPTGMSCTIEAGDAAHHYRILTTYITDPASDAVLMRTSFYGPRGDQLYVRLDPLAGGTGGGSLPNPPSPENAGGNTAELVNANGQQVPVDYNRNTLTNAVNRTYAVRTYMALESSAGFSSASVGYAGTPSDGLTMLDSSHSLTPYTSAPDGHVALTAQIPTRWHHSVTLALGFGQSESQAVSVASASVGRDFGRVWAGYEAGWLRYDAGLRRPARSLGPAAVREYYESVNVVKASEDKTFAGAIAAGLASPWGQSVPAGEYTSGEPTYFGSYREEFSRDMYEAFTGLLVAGDVQTARDATKFLFDRQQLSDGSMPRNSLPNGESAPDTGGLQLDECSYPILMDWESGLAGDRTLYRDHVIPAADFVVAHGPSDGNERWEEQSGYSPSTIAAEIAGLTAAAAIARVNHDQTHAAIYQAAADYFARNIETWTVTTNGPFISPTVPSYFIRIAKAADPNSPEQVDLGNGSITVDQRSLIDAGFLELVRLGVLPASDPVIKSSLTVVDDTIERQTPNGPGFYRYGTTPTESVDGYGDCFQPSGSSCTVTGAPWPPTDKGTGHLWPVLSGERGEYDLAAGMFGDAGGLLTAMRKMTSGQGLEPEQVWEDPALPASPSGTDPSTASIGFTDGQPAGSASPLTWAQAQYARLALDLSAGHDLDTPSIVSDRYIRHGMPAALPLAMSSPANGARVTASTLTVSGTTTPGAAVTVQAWNVFTLPAQTASTIADGSGNWSVPIPVGFGATTITATAALGSATGYAQATVSNAQLPGTTVLSVPNPGQDDNGPGTYQYPTAADFHPGAFDLTGMTINEDTHNVYLQVGVQNLAPTFGTQFGAQLLDFYIRDPSAAAFSNQAAFASRNYTIGSPWSERIEAQGFAPVVWVNATGQSLGNGQLVVDQTGSTATVVVPRAAFGNPGSGWVFTVALTGQDGFSPDQARAFTSTPGAYSFGVCASGGTAKICSVDPSTVPKVMSTLAPGGVAQQHQELNLTENPVVLAGVPIP